ncbi:hypothetical protein Ais01nite_72000 [Asanoa ishikariensis]|uniref:Catechol-2,3-dioxygenase n=1 Tax=Asanoa ishikariensis TaxID=137265 RepID=A0A1H3UQ65_9ACTN|nr:VOC family protein [Asanoa ishikariensis]GIF69165.1 hypothetical protein Ais01nite_72000 [Asanoa ishikariensis]SDZ64356.1 Catechol-2,3-dioxygenase [Asanoa ishikariensis]
MTTEAIPSTRLHTVRLGVRDLDRSTRFYRDLLGFTEVRDGLLSAGPALVELTEIGPDGTIGDWVNDDLQGGVRHVGLKVSDVDDRIRRLESAGVTVLSPPADVLGDVRIAFFLDPDGARLEYIQGALNYQVVHSPDHVDAEAADLPGPRDAPRFDHVAVTVADLAATLRFYCDGLGFELIGQIRHHDDPRGFLMTYLRAGAAVLEVFSFDVPTGGNPTPPAEAPLVGFRSVSVAAEDLPAAVVRAVAAGGRLLADRGTSATLLDPDGVLVTIRSQS